MSEREAIATLVAIIVLGALYPLALELWYRHVAFPKAKRQIQRQSQAPVVPFDRARVADPRSTPAAPADDALLCVRVRVTGMGSQDNSDAAIYPALIGDGSIDSRGVTEVRR